MPSRHSARLGLLALITATVVAGPSFGQQDDPVAWSTQAARGAFDLCRGDAPDADRVAEHGQIWGWPTFMGYQETPRGYKREAGGESRRDFSHDGKTAYVELEVQSGEVTSETSANIHYFRCNLASDHAVNTDLTAYFTGLYGQPISKTDDATIWLSGEAGASVTADNAVNDDAALKPVVAAAVGAKVTRIELTREDGIDRARLTIFQSAPPPS
jgi:hypothetical protein